MAVANSLAIPAAETLKPSTTPVGVSHETFVDDLKARLATEQDQEVKDTIQATLNSLSSEAAVSSSHSSDFAAEPKGKERLLSSASVLSSVGKVERIESTFRALQSNFVFPPQLDFITRPATVAGENTEAAAALAHLAYTARNHPVRYYEQSLLTLLTDLDFIESEGDVALRSKRKEAVRVIEQALEVLESEVMGRWRVSLAKRGESSVSASTSGASSPAQQTEAALPEVAAPTAPHADGTPEIIDAKLEDPISPSSLDLESSRTAAEASSVVREPVAEADPSACEHEAAAPESDLSAIDDSQLTVRAADNEVANNFKLPLSYARVAAQSEFSAAPHTAPIPDESTPAAPESIAPETSSDAMSETFLLARADAPSTRRKQASDNVENEDIGSDWSELDSA
jgi:hypothetical protein